jgi:hypothetical protein
MGMLAAKDRETPLRSAAAKNTPVDGALTALLALGPTLTRVCVGRSGGAWPCGRSVPRLRANPVST